MNRHIELLRGHGELHIIDERVDVFLEAGHIAYVEMKKEGGGKALLFTNLYNSRLGVEYKTPVLANLFGSAARCELIFGRHPDKIAAQIDSLLHIHPPSSIRQKLGMLSELAKLRNIFPKNISKGRCQEVVLKEGEFDIGRVLPIWTTWPDDGGPFITMGQVYTKSLDGKMRNVGMYRLQLYDDGALGMHWQIHKDSSHFFHDYRKAGLKMPVAIAIGGDPLLTWCATAPAPLGVFELLFYGLIRNAAAKMVRCRTVDLDVPSDADFVIEGFVDPNDERIEGPFGDHTGYYTPREPYPVLHPTCLTHAKDCVYYSTVVGKPPIEDKYMGWATERIFLPLLRTANPDMLDYTMPENGVFHNLVIAKLRTLYPAHAKQAMHSLWGVGQMSFVKHALFVGEDAPPLEDRAALLEYICDRIDLDELLLSYGVADALDHSGERFAQGGKLGIDCTQTPATKRELIKLSDDELSHRAMLLSPQIAWVAQYQNQSATPLAVAGVRRTTKTADIFKDLIELKPHIRVLALVDADANDRHNGYMLLWRICNNFDSARDFYKDGDFVLLDGTAKSSEIDGFKREWPADVVCDKTVFEKLREKGVIAIGDEEIKKFGLL